MPADVLAYRANKRNNKNMNKKPDALLILALIFGLGVLVSTLTHGDGRDPVEGLAAAPVAQQTEISR